MRNQNIQKIEVYDMELQTNLYEKNARKAKYVVKSSKKYIIFIEERTQN